MIIGRRGMLAGGAALLVGAPLAARAGDELFRGPGERRLRLTGSMKQGGLVVGRAEGAHQVTVDGERVSLSSNWEFAFGIAHERTDAVRIAVTYADGERRTEEALPVVRRYEEQAITGLPPRTVEPLPQDRARIEREHALVAEARKTDSDETWFTAPFRWPARGRISGVFGSRRILNGVAGARHFGVDIAAPTGAPIRAPAGGRVLIAQEFFLEGGFTLLDHGQGVFTGYMHQSRIMVAPGEVVLTGQRIGSVGATGRATGPHLHWSMNWFQTRLDPSLSARSPEPDKA